MWWCLTTSHFRALVHGVCMGAHPGAIFLSHFVATMPDDFALRVAFLAGLLGVVSLFISWYLKGDPLVGPRHLVLAGPDQQIILSSTLSQP